MIFNLNTSFSTQSGSSNWLIFKLNFWKTNSISDYGKSWDISIVHDIWFAHLFVLILKNEFQEETVEDWLEKEREQLLNEGDFTEYKVIIYTSFVYVWKNKRFTVDVVFLTICSKCIFSQTKKSLTHKKSYVTSLEMIGVAYFIFVTFSFFSAESELSANFHFPRIWIFLILWLFYVV